MRVELQKTFQTREQTFQLAWFHLKVLLQLSDVDVQHDLQCSHVVHLCLHQLCRKRQNQNLSVIKPLPCKKSKLLSLFSAVLVQYQLMLCFQSIRKITLCWSLNVTTVSPWSVKLIEMTVSKISLTVNDILSLHHFFWVIFHKVLINCQTPRLRLQVLGVWLQIRSHRCIMSI